MLNSVNMYRDMVCRRDLTTICSGCSGRRDDRRSVNIARRCGEQCVRCGRRFGFRQQCLNLLWHFWRRFRFRAMRLVPSSAMYTKVKLFRIEIVLSLILHEHSDVVPRSEFLPGLLALWWKYSQNYICNNLSANYFSSKTFVLLYEQNIPFPSGCASFSLREMLFPTRRQSPVRDYYGSTRS